jgi:hypothetical protein
MKKIIFILLLSLSFIGIKAQDALSEYNKTTDTVAQSATVYMYLPRISGLKTVTISPRALNISGTTGMNATLSAYVTVGSGLTGYWVPLTVNNCADLTAANDTIALLTATAGVWVIKSNASLLRVKFTAGGATQSSKVGAAYEIK